MSSVVVFVNPQSRANRRDPRLSARFGEMLGAQGRVVAPASLDELGQEARRLATEPPRAVAIHGGDGTLHRVISALLRGFGQTPLPPLAILPGGTMNVVASSLGIRASPEHMLAALAADTAAGRAPATLARRCLQVGDSYGFVFGNGMIANFLEEYYAHGGYGPPRALWVAAHIFGSALVGGPFAQRVFRRFEGRVWLDGEPLPWTSLTAVGAATVREVGMGFKLNHRADEDPERFAALAIHSGPLRLTADILPVYRGRGIAPERAWNALGAHLVIEPTGTETTYTIDGDLYQTRGRIEVRIGPALRFVAPAATPAR